MHLRLCLLVCLAFAAAANARGIKPFLTTDFVHKINAAQTTWTASPSKFMTWSRESIQRLMGVRPEYAAQHKLIKPIEHDVPNDLPTNFDAREQWPNCATIKEVRDQGRFVRSSFACCTRPFFFVSVPAVEAAGLLVPSKPCRIVSASLQAELKTSTSPLKTSFVRTHLVSRSRHTIDLFSSACCSACGFGCDGGFPQAAWSYFKTSGLVTGGNYNTQQGCEPYSIASCDHQ